MARIPTVTYEDRRTGRLIRINHDDVRRRKKVSDTHRQVGGIDERGVQTTYRLGNT